MVLIDNKHEIIYTSSMINLGEHCRDVLLRSSPFWTMLLYLERR